MCIRGLRLGLLFLAVAGLPALGLAVGPDLRAWLGARGPSEPPHVSATPIDDAIAGELAAYVEIEGRNFHVYVGSTPVGGTATPLWAVAVPAESRARAEEAGPREFEEHSTWRR